MKPRVLSFFFGWFLFSPDLDERVEQQSFQSAVWLVWLPRPIGNVL